MIHDEFLSVANELAQGITEGHWRSAVSRAYYAAYHRTRFMIEAAGGNMPAGERCHEQLASKLRGPHRGLTNIGTRLDHFRRDRNAADYARRSFSRTDAIAGVREATILLQLIDACEKGDAEHLRRSIAQGFS